MLILQVSALSCERADFKIDDISVNYYITGSICNGKGLELQIDKLYNFNDFDKLNPLENIIQPTAARQSDTIYGSILISIKPLEGKSFDTTIFNLERLGEGLSYKIDLRDDFVAQNNTNYQIKCEIEGEEMKTNVYIPKVILIDTVFLNPKKEIHIIPNKTTLFESDSIIFFSNLKAVPTLGKHLNISFNPSANEHQTIALVQKNGYIDYFNSQYIFYQDNFADLPIHEKYDISIDQIRKGVLIEYYNYSFFQFAFQSYNELNYNNSGPVNGHYKIPSTLNSNTFYGYITGYGQTKLKIK